MSCSMIAAEMPVPRTTEVIVSMIGAFSRVDTPLVGSSRKKSFCRSAQATSPSGSFPAPVGPEQGEHPAPLHREAPVAHRVRVPEPLDEVLRDQETHGWLLPWSRATSRSAVPTIPVGSERTSATSTAPSRSCQYTV